MGDLVSEKLNWNNLLLRFENNNLQLYMNFYYLLSLDEKRNPTNMIGT